MPTPTLQQALQRLPYPSSMQPISGIPGKAFFPGGRGLWNDGDSNPADKKYMVLGQDFDTVYAFDRALAAGEEDVQKNAAWRNLLAFLKECNITPEECFFTNAIMGARVEGNNSGRSPAFKDNAFIAACRAFFLLQLEAQKPEVILVLGKEPARFLAPFSDDLKAWKKEQSFAKIDAAGEQVKQNVAFENGITAHLVLLTHPSFRPSNVHRRRYEEAEGHAAEVAMVLDLK